MTNTTVQKPCHSRSLVGAETLLRELFGDDPPTLRWLRGMQGRVFPYRKIGRRVFFDVEECRKVIDEQFKVESIG